MAGRNSSLGFGQGQGNSKKDLIRIYHDPSGRVCWKRQRFTGQVLKTSDETSISYRDTLLDMRLHNPDWESCKVVDHAVGRESVGGQRLR